MRKIYFFNLHLFLFSEYYFQFQVEPVVMRSHHCAFELQVVAEITEKKVVSRFRLNSIDKRPRKNHFVLLILTTEQSMYYMMFKVRRTIAALLRTYRMQ